MSTNFANDIEDREPFYNARSAFVDRFCAAKQWDANGLTWEQIQEIRRQPEWNAPPIAADPETYDCIPDDSCDACGSKDKVFSWGMGDKAMFDVCPPCFKGDGFHQFLTREFERALIVHDGNKKLADGKWTTNPTA